MNRIIIVALVAALACTSYGAYVIGNWESQTAEGWGLWDGGVVENPNFAYSSEIGVTRGNYSLEVTQDGWGQVLAIDLTAAQRQGFMENRYFVMDVSVQASANEFTAGWSQVYEIVFNGDGGGWQTVISGTPISFYWWEGEIPMRTERLVFDYRDYRNSMNPDPSYLQIVIALNTGGGAPDKMYIDNVMFAPEPATIAMLGIGALALLRKRS